MAKGKHKTPTELDPLFKRGTISEEMYGDFWDEYWKASRQSDRDDLVRFYMTESIEERVTEAIEEGEGAEVLPLQGTLTKNRKEAEKQAKIIGGYVARRTKSGRFSKRGRIYQAIKKTRRKK